MSKINNHYNVAIKSRYYAFLQEDIESIDPDIIIATAEKKREITKENKSKAKKEKHTKQINENKKEITENESNQIEEPVRIEKSERTKQDLEEKENIKVDEGFQEKRLNERKTDRNERGQKNNNRRIGRGGSIRTDEKTLTDEVPNKSSNEELNKSSRPYRKERTDDRDGSFMKVGNFEEDANNRGVGAIRRPYNRGPRFPRDGVRPSGDDGVNLHGNSGGRFEDAGEGEARANRGRFMRSNRGGVGRSSRTNEGEKVDTDAGRMGYFQESVDIREHRGSGRGRGTWGPRRGGRGNYRQSVESGEGVEEVQLGPVTGSDVPVGDVIDTEGAATVATDGQAVEADPVETRNTVVMTLEKWRALNPSRDRVPSAISSSDTRKANDGHDVFSGMSQYRKGRSVDIGDDSETGESVQPRGGKQQSIPSMEVRFSRHVEMVVQDQGSVERPVVVGRGRGRARGRGGGGGGGGAGRVEVEARPPSVSINLGNEEEFPHLS